jgi:uncharacterized protein YcbK (DUF882 family)
MSKEKYTQFLSGLQLRNFSPDEVMFLGARNASLQSNTLPPEAIWPNIVKTLWIVQLCRDNVGPLRLLSIYRSPQYNREIDGAVASIHLQNKAIDIQPITASVGRLWDTLMTWRNAGLFDGGLGRYPTFVHIDTRGVNATWSG